VSTIYVLIVVTGVYGGSVVSFQEFSSHAACIGAKEVVANMYRIRTAECVQK
jgi:hypothetical protein